MKLQYALLLLSTAVELCSAIPKSRGGGGNLLGSKSVNVPSNTAKVSVNTAQPSVTGQPSNSATGQSSNSVSTQTNSKDKTKSSDATTTTSDAPTGTCPSYSRVVAPTMTGDVGGNDALMRYRSRWVCTLYQPASDAGPGNDPIDQCKDVCGNSTTMPADPLGIKSWTCVGGQYQWTDPQTGQPTVVQPSTTNLTENYEFYHGGPNFHAILGGQCSCNDPVINFIGAEFVQLAIVAADVACEMWVDAFNIILQVGEIALDFVPGVGEVNMAMDAGMKAAIYAAKYFRYAYKGYDKASDFADWAGMSFGLQGKCHTDFNIFTQPCAMESSYDPLVNANDSYINFQIPDFPEGACVGKKPRDCKLTLPSNAGS